MADNLRKVPKKGILKSSSSFEKPESYKCNQKEMKWDEMNILQTLHPPDKDYGHMKIDEPKTPYTHYKDPEDGGQRRGSADPHSDDEQTDGIDADLLAKKIQVGLNKLPKAMVNDDEDDDDDEEEEYLNETEEERAKRKIFEQKRKLHYNEYYAIKLARKLMEEEKDNEEEDEDDDDDEKGEGNCGNEDDDSEDDDNNKESVITDGQKNAKRENQSHSSSIKSVATLSKGVGDDECD